MKELDKIVRKMRITDGEAFHLDDYDSANPLGKELDDKDEAKAILAGGIKKLADLQDKLYAQDQWSLLLIFQAPDAAGKDSTIKHVMSGINPQGCEVSSFKRPSDEELSHDYMWRCLKRLPERGRIGIFNRSYYEEVLVVRVHPKILDSQHLPEKFRSDPDIFDKRLKDIRNIEHYLTRNGTRIVKFFLNVSKDEQKKRLLDRLDEPDKNWKFEVKDLDERALWDDYHKAYNKLIKATATKKAPWYVIPADNKWFMRAAVVRAILHEMESLDLAYPKVTKEEKAGFAEARKRLMSEK